MLRKRSCRLLSRSQSKVKRSASKLLTTLTNKMRLCKTKEWVLRLKMLMSTLIWTWLTSRARSDHLVTPLARVKDLRLRSPSFLYTKCSHMTHKLNTSPQSSISSRSLTCLRVKKGKLRLTLPIQIDPTETPKFLQAEASFREILLGSSLETASCSQRTSTQKITLRWSRSGKKLSLTKRKRSKRKSPRSLKRSWSRQGLSSAKMWSSKNGWQKNKKK